MGVFNPRDDRAERNLGVVAEVPLSTVIPSVGNAHLQQNPISDSCIILYILYYILYYTLSMTRKSSYNKHILRQILRTNPARHCFLIHTSYSQNQNKTYRRYQRLPAVFVSRNVINEESS